MRSIILIIFPLLIPSIVLSQGDTTFLVLKNGHTIPGASMSYEDHLLDAPQFLLDGSSYSTNDISFISNRHGYFANLEPLFGEKSERYALRIATGKIDLYEEIDMMIYGQGDISFSAEDDPLLATGEVFQFYSLNNGPIRKARYRNLKADLATSEASLAHLKRFRNYRWLQRVLIAGGAGIILANFVSQPSSELRLSPLAAGGLVLGGCSYFFEEGKQEEKWKAVQGFE